jgi:hypothetical protein
MNKCYLYLLSICLFLSCQKKKTLNIINPVVNSNVIDTKYIINESFTKGDVRRYGIFPNQKISQKHLSKVISLAAEGLPLIFPKGNYDTNLILKDVSNINFIFQEAIINGAVNILDGSSNIKFEGELTMLDKLFIRKSNNIQFDRIIVKSDTIENLYHKKNRGASIYAGSKKIFFNYLKIENTGGAPDEFYKFAAAALQIHGWNNNPEQVFIHKLEIHNSARTALYLTGKGHKIDKVAILNFGLGSSKNMFGLEDAVPGEEKEFAGAWINRCNDCEIDSLSITNNFLKGKFSLRLDEGLYHEPTFIYNLHFGVKVKELPVKDDLLTNILVKNEY